MTAAADHFQALLGARRGAEHDRDPDRPADILLLDTGANARAEHWRMCCSHPSDPAQPATVTFATDSGDRHLELDDWLSSLTAPAGAVVHEHSFDLAGARIIWFADTCRDVHAWLQAHAVYRRLRRPVPSAGAGA